MKWAEVATSSDRTRFETLSAHLNEQGFKNEVEFIEVTPADFSVELVKALEKYDTIRIGQGLGEIVLKEFKSHPAEIQSLRACDSIVKSDGRWWPRCMGLFGMQRILTQVGVLLDIERPALVVGAGAGARIAICGLVRAGFKEINITNQYDEQAMELIQDLRRFWFDVNFKRIPKERLILLPGTNSILVNTTPFVPENEVLDELYYFNFLKRPGVTVDFMIEPVETPLIKEALGIGAKVVHGYEVAAQTDCHWASQVLGVALDAKKYSEVLKAKIS